MKIYSSDYIRYELLKDLLFLYPKKNKRTFFGIGSSRSSETLRNGHCVIRSSPDIFREFERQGLVKLEYLSDKERVELGVEDHVDEIIDRDIKKIKKSLAEIRSKHNITTDFGERLTLCPTNWKWHDRGSGEYQFGAEGIVKVGGKKHGKEAFQAIMNVFEETGIVPIDTVFNAGKFKTKRDARIFLNRLTKRSDFKNKGLSFVPSGKGYYCIYYNPFPNP